MNKITMLVAGLILVLVALVGGREADMIPVEYLDMVGVEPSYGCDVPAIKGNVTKDAKIYHVPGGVHYNQVKVQPENGERLFCTEADAVAAGWVKSKN